MVVEPRAALAASLERIGECVTGPLKVEARGNRNASLKSLRAETGVDGMSVRMLPSDDQRLRLLLHPVPLRSHARRLCSL